jgi:hypothetical protein
MAWGTTTLMSTPLVSDIGHHDGSPSGTQRIRAVKVGEAEASDVSGAVP